MNHENVATLKGGMTVLVMMLALGGCRFGEDRQAMLEAANLKKAAYCMDVIENQHDLEAARQKCFAETYIQHSPHVSDGRDAVLEVFASRFEKYPNYSMELKRTAADGDLVWMHMHTKREPQALGYAVINIFRMKDGKFAEHWNVGQPVPEESANDNTMF